jgi:hypothetical protein
VGESFTEFEETNGMPRYYDLVGNVIRLKPAPDAAQVTLVEGLRLELIREQNEFTAPETYTADDTTEPGFDEAFHEIICYGIAHDYLIANKPELAQAYYQRIELLRQDMSKHYGGKNKDVKLSVKPVVEDYQ